MEYKNNNSLITLDELFERSIFRIPDYQRGYSWGDRQLIEFWEDLLTIPSNYNHYTGMISLKPIKDLSDKKWNDTRWLKDERGFEHKFYHIVDGQQRMTTFVILINEIVKFVKGLDENAGRSDDEIKFAGSNLSEIKKRYLVIAPSEIIKSFKFGYEEDNPSYDYFKNRILEEVSGVVEETFYTLNLQNAKDFFAQQLKDLYEENDNNLGIIEKVFIDLTTRFQFNLYIIEDDFNVFVAFETMNNRGKRLSKLELLKNRLIYLSTISDNSEIEKDQVRRNINSVWKEIYHYLGRNKKKALDDDDFLQAHWIIYFGYTRNTAGSFENFLLNEHFTKKNADLTLTEINRYIESLRQLIPYWYYLHYPLESNLSEEIQDWLMKLGRLEFAYFKPLTTVVISQEIPDDQKIRYLKATERWIFLLFRFCRYFQTYQNSKYYNYARDLYNDNLDIEDIIDELEHPENVDDNGIISTVSVMDRVRILSGYEGYYSWKPLSYLLYEYELHLKNNLQSTDVKLSPEAIFTKNKKDYISIEHIYPQTGTDKYWKERFGEYDEKSQKRLKNSLGNLLPLSKSINSAFQNDAFPLKKNGTGRRERCYKNGCLSEIEVADYQEWTPKNIKERGLKILEFMEQRWGFKFESEEAKLQTLMLDKLEKKKEWGIDEEPVSGLAEIIPGSIESEIEHLIKDRSSTEKAVGFFKELHNYALSLSPAVEYKINKYYVGYTMGDQFLQIHIQKNGVYIQLCPIEYEDEAGKVIKMPDYFGRYLNRKVYIKEPSDVEYVKQMIKKSFDSIS